MAKPSRQLSRAIAQMMRSRAVDRELKAQANIALAFLKQAAPYDTNPKRPKDKPHYRDNLLIERDTSTDGRIVYRVVANVDHAIGVEANTGLLKSAARLVR